MADQEPPEEGQETPEETTEEIQNEDQQPDSADEEHDQQEGDSADVEEEVSPEEVIEEKDNVPEAGKVENLDRILSLKVPFQVILSEKDVRMRDVLAFQVGSLIEFEKLSDEHLDIYVNERRFGFGEVVKIQEKFGIRIKGMISLKEKIKKLGI